LVNVVTGITSGSSSLSLSSFARCSSTVLIVGVCDRPIGFLEAYYSGRSLDNKFGIVIIDLKTNKKGKEEGEGVLIYAAKVTVLEGNKVEVENLGIDPVKLMAVRKF